MTCSIQCLAYVVHDTLSCTRAFGRMSRYDVNRQCQKLWLLRWVNAECGHVSRGQSKLNAALHDTQQGYAKMQHCIKCEFMGELALPGIANIHTPVAVR